MSMIRHSMAVFWFQTLNERIWKGWMRKTSLSIFYLNKGWFPETWCALRFGAFGMLLSAIHEEALLFMLCNANRLYHQHCQQCCVKVATWPIGVCSFCFCPVFAVPTRWWWRRNVHAEHEAQQKSSAATLFPFTSRMPRCWTHSTTSLLSSRLQGSTHHSRLLLVTTRPTTATGTPLCCLRKATASITRLSAQPTGWVFFFSVLPAWLTSSRGNNKVLKYNTNKFSTVLYSS